MNNCTRQKRSDFTYKPINEKIKYCEKKIEKNIPEEIESCFISLKKLYVDSKETINEIS